LQCSVAFGLIVNRCIVSRHALQQLLQHVPLSWCAIAGTPLSLAEASRSEAVAAALLAVLQAAAGHEPSCSSLAHFHHTHLLSSTRCSG
jgi:hypothetical protein